MDSDQKTLNSIVIEYLRFCGFHKTLAVFKEEQSGKSISGQFSEGLKNSDNESKLLSYFDKGNFKNFFKLWNNYFESKKGADVDLTELTFMLHIYFALYPIKYDIKDTEGAMESLNVFLTANGDFLSKSGNTLSYFALPYVSNLKQHSSYSHLFKDEWANGLKNNLQRFLNRNSSVKPKLLEIYKFSKNASNGPNDSGTHFSKFLKDYNEIIETTADLIDLLDTAVKGNHITQEQVEQLTRKLFQEEALKGTDMTRPGTAARTLRDSVVMSYVDNRSLVNSTKMHGLDYKKINNDLAVVDDQKKCVLFQALRWNLARDTKDDRQAVLQEYLSHDILQCVQRQSKSLARMLNGNDELVKLSFVQLLSALASFYKGRSYIAKKESMVESLIKSIQSQNFDITTKECLLGCLQRLSLRGNIQLLMIERNVIEWLVGEIALNDGSPLIVEYGITLLTNLCLRSAGRNKSAEIAPRILGLLSKLLQSNFSPDIESCIIGTLYSILSVKSTKEVALNMGFLELLRGLQKSTDETIEKHKQFVISRLTSSQDDDLDQSKEDEIYDDDDDDNDDDDGNISEPNNESLPSHLGKFRCEQLLHSEYTRDITQDLL